MQSRNHRSVLRSIAAAMVLTTAAAAGPPCTIATGETCGDGLFPLEVQPAPKPVFQRLHDHDGNGALSLVTVTADTPSSQFNVYADILPPDLGEPVVMEIDGFVVGGAFADLDADADHDAVVTVFDPETGLRSFAVYENTGEDHFVPRGGGALPGRFRSVAVANLNNDAWPDLVLAGADDLTQAVAVSLGTAPYSFGPSVVFPTESWPRSVVATDLTRDGQDEVVVRATVFPDQPRTPKPNTFLFTYRWVDDSLVEADVTPAVGVLMLTADLVPGGPDELLLVGSSIRAFRWKTDGFKLLSALSIDGTAAVDAFDWDGDGDTDVVTAGPQSTQVHLHEGDGVFAHAETYPVSGNRVVAGDLDGNGHVDLLVYRDPGIIALVRQDDGQLATFVPLPPAGSAAGFAAGDFTGDGRDDLIGFSSYPATWHLYQQQEDGCFVEVDTVESSGDRPADARTADLDGDGDSDVVTTVQPGLLHVAINDGELSAITSYAIGVDVRRLDVGDLDLDGDLDIAIGIWQEQRFEIRLNDGAGGFDEHHSFDSERLNGVAIADLDRDGLPDLVTCNASANQVSVFRNLGDLEFAETATYDIPAGSTYLAGIEAADLDKDGIEDIVVMNYSTGTARMFVLLADGRGGLLPATRYDCRSGAHDVEIGDVDRDAILDLVVGNWLDGSVSVFRGLGDGTFDAPIIVAAYAYLSVTLHDITADGNLDLLIGGDVPALMPNLSCPLGDLDQDGSVGSNDLCLLVHDWGPCAESCPADLDNDGGVDYADLLLLLDAWGS